MAAAGTNVLIIHADQHRADCLGCYGNQQIQTPNIDALAADGVTYTEHFCSYPVCTPSRYSLLTGLYVHQHLGWGNHSGIPHTMPSLPATLRDAGYATKAVGKMHFTPTYLDIGFSEMELAEQDGPGRFDDDYHRYLREHDLVDAIDVMDQRWEYRQQAPKPYYECFGAAESDLPEEHHSTTWIGDRAVDTLENWGADGNMLMVGFIKPHHPFDPPAPWSTMYDPDDIEILPGWTETCLARDEAFRKGYFPNDKLTREGLQQIMAMYYGTISHIDQQVGRLVAALKERGLYDNTLIVYTSDHGDFMGFHHMVLKGNYLYDPLARIPLVVKYPDNVQAGTSDRRLSSNVDVAPTILQRLGLESARMSGGDLLDANAARDCVCAVGSGGGQYMARTQTHKLILCIDDKQSLLFDLARDPLELVNVYGDPEYAEVRRALNDRLLRWMLFDARTLDYMDEHDRTIRADNARGFDARDDGGMEEYYKAKLAAVDADGLFGE